MIRFVFRLIGLISLALGFIFLVYDGTKSIADQAMYWTRFEDVWNALYSNPPQDVLQPVVDRLSAHFLWDPVILPVLVTPICIVLIVLGSVLILLGRKKKPLIGYAR